MQLMMGLCFTIIWYILNVAKGIDFYFLPAHKWGRETRTGFANNFLAVLPNGLYFNLFYHVIIIIIVIYIDRIRLGNM